MTIGLTAIDQFLKNLDTKARYYAVTVLLPTLTRSQLEKIDEKLERLIDKKYVEQETSILYDYREVKGNHYAYIKRIGKEYFNIYLGVMRFRAGRVYKITHKTENKYKIVRSLGLERRGVKTYLKIEFIYPESAIRSYLFYDPTLDVPRRPQTTDLEGIDEQITQGDREVILSTPEQDFLTKKSYQRLSNSREDWSAIFVKKDWTVEEIKDPNKSPLAPEQSRNSSKHSITEPYKDIPVLLPNKKQVPISQPPESLYKKKTVQPKQEITSIEVNRNFAYQVEVYLQQWAVFSQILPNSPQWQLIVEANTHKLIEQAANRTIIEYETTSRRLSAKSVRTLYNLLYGTISNVASNKFVPKEQQALAQRWILKLQNPPLANEQELLAFIFSL